MTQAAPGGLEPASADRLRGTYPHLEQTLPGAQPSADLIGDQGEAAKKLRLLWVSCGDEDRLMEVSRRLHTALEEKQVPHVWHVDKGGHTWPVWKNDLYLLAQRLFR